MTRLYLHIMVTIVFGILAERSDSFVWDASLDSTTGLARSQEQSSFLLGQAGGSPNDFFSFNKISRDHVASWADFLCQGSVTFGMLQAKRKPDSQSVSLKIRGFSPLSILTFGPIKERKGSNRMGLSELENDKNVLVRSWEIPIEKSWLSLAGPNSERGCLVFKFTVRNGARKRVDKKSIDEKVPICELETQIEDYRPWIAGNPPISKLRKVLYLGVQSRLHAYVTYKFHQAWKNNLLKEIQIAAGSSLEQRQR